MAGPSISRDAGPGAVSGTASPPLPGLSGGYRPVEGLFDEFVGADGVVRPAWQSLSETLDAVGEDGLRRRAEQLDRVVREFGVTYNVYREASAGSRDWEMDLVPFLLRSDEWSGLEAALGQRVRLLNEVLADCYGPQRLLERGRLPADLVLGNPKFLPACHRLLPPHHRHLWFYSADLARAPDGTWWVLSDRLDAASGVGYALMNRQLTHRVLPELIRVGHVRRLAPFLDRLRESLEYVAPSGTDDPNPVLLTPGPRNETYFEHAFMARSLGYSLVEGDDLTVRDGRVLLKTISGTLPVHVVLRRLDSEWCDPLELRHDSLLGVAGLVQVVRDGRVSVVNGLGSGLLEGPAFSAFLPALCRQVLGEDLALPSVATWWCGQAAERRYVLENLPFLQLKPAVPGTRRSPVFGPSLSGAECEAWRRRILAEPEAWCAQERVDQATTPAFVDGRLEPRPFLLRVFLVRHHGRYRMMPGGLVRISSGVDGADVSMQSGGISKDAWVLGPEPEPEAERIEVAVTRSGAPHVRRGANTLPSRVADNLFWLGRYFERAETQTRLLRVIVSSLMDDPWGDQGRAVVLLFAALASEDELVGLRPRGRGRGGRASRMINVEAAEGVLRWWKSDASNAEGLPANLAAVLRTAGQVKERLSVDTWQLLSRLDGLCASLPFRGGALLDDATLRDLDEIIVLLSGVSGMSTENMSRGHGWTFLDLGRRVERSLSLCNLLHATLRRRSSATQAEPLLHMLLWCADSLLTYRRRYLTALHPAPVLDLLVGDAGNPRSLAFQARRIEEHVASLPDPRGEALANPIERVARRLSSHVGLFDVDVVESTLRGSRRIRLEEFLDAAAGELARMSNLLGAHYFAVTIRPTTRHGGAGFVQGAIAPV